MKALKLEDWDETPQDYTGIVEWKCGNKSWVKNGKHHRENGPAHIKKIGYKIWYLDGKYVWDSHAKLGLTNQIILSKTQHPLYPTVQVWKILDKDRVWQQIVIPGMEKYIQE